MGSLILVMTLVSLSLLVYALSQPRGGKSLKMLIAACVIGGFKEPVYWISGTNTWLSSLVSMVWIGCAIYYYWRYRQLQKK